MVTPTNLNKVFCSHLPVIEESSSENNGVFIAPVGGVAPLKSDWVPVVLVSDKANQPIGERLPRGKTKLSLRRKEGRESAVINMHVQ